MTTDRTITLTQSELNDMVEGRLGKERRRLLRLHAKEVETLRAELQQERQRRLGARLRRWLWGVN
jgi:hypothetical protein